MITMLDKTFIDNLKISVYLKNTHGEYTYCNSYMANMIGISPAEKVIGKSDFDLFSSKYADQLKYMDSQVISNDQTMVMEEQIIALNDSSKARKNLLSIKTPVKDKDQNTVGIVGISINLEQQNAADFNKNLVEELIYTNILSVLRQVKHDIRGPLGAVNGFAELIIGAKNDPDRIEYLANYLLKSCSAMNSFVESLTNSCIYYQDRSESHKTLFNVNNLAQNIYDIAAPMAYQNKLKLEYASELDSEFTLFGFKDVISRLLMELTNNAIKHTEKGVVSLKVYAPEDNNSVVKIDVFNTGKELSQEQISRILNTQELNDDGLIKGQGFGLGMVGTLAKSIEIGIEVSTSKHSGTTITLILPNEKSN